MHTSRAPGALACLAPGGRLLWALDLREFALLGGCLNPLAVGSAAKPWFASPPKALV